MVLRLDSKRVVSNRCLLRATIKNGVLYSSKWRADCPRHQRQASKRSFCAHTLDLWLDWVDNRGGSEHG